MFEARYVDVKHVCPAHPINVLWETDLAVRWPIHNIDVVFGKKVRADVCNVRPCIVLLERQCTLANGWNNVWH